MAITTLEKVKTILGINDTSKDTRITALIPLVEDWIKGYCNDDFLDSNGATVYPAGYELTAIKMIDYDLHIKSGVTSKSTGKLSVSFTDDYPKSIIRGLRKKVKFV